jgi:hypothetical protein
VTEYASSNEQNRQEMKGNAQTLSISQNGTVMRLSGGQIVRLQGNPEFLVDGSENP